MYCADVSAAAFAEPEAQEDMKNEKRRKRGKRSFIGTGL
jgi:hypothetical protein